MNGITHRLVGYDRATERVVEEYAVPDGVLPSARSVAHVPEGDPEAAMCYPLSAGAARDLAGFINAGVDPERNDYFLEGFPAE